MEMNLGYTISFDNQTWWSNVLHSVSIEVVADWACDVQQEAHQRELDNLDARRRKEAVKHLRFDGGYQVASGYSSCLVMVQSDDIIV